MKHIRLLILITLTALQAKAQLPVPELAPPDTTAGSSVVTIYFCGTGITQKWWNAYDAHNWNGTTGFWSSELVSSLYKEQNTSPKSIKYIVDGIGTGVNILGYDLVAFAFPSLKSNPRGWRTCLKEGTDHIDEALKLLPGNITLNIVGFSRGGVLAMWLAQKMEKEKRILAINLLVFEPVPGDKKVPEKIYTLGEKVKSFVGFYASDERTGMFEPVIPDFESPSTKVWMLRMPGSHETLVGNIQKDGHSIDFETTAEVYVPELLSVSWVTKVVSMEILKSKDWGHVQFKRGWHEEETPLDSLKSRFLKQFNTMNSYGQYSYMRSVPFVPMNIYAYGTQGLRGTGCFRCNLFDMAAKNYNNIRCAYIAHDGKKLQSIGLQNYIKAPTGEEVWAKILEIRDENK